MGTSERRERERLELRQRILDEARKLFAAHGYEAVTMRTIAEAAEYSPRTIYLYFKDKEDLIREICAEDFRSFGKGLATALAIADPLDRLRAIGLGYARFAQEYPHHYKLMFMSPPLLGDHADKEDKGNPEADAYALLLGTIQEAIDAGLLRPELQDAHLAAQVIWSAIHGVVALELTHGCEAFLPWAPFGRRVDTVLDLISNGIRR